MGAERTWSIAFVEKRKPVRKSDLPSWGKMGTAIVRRQ